jgi:ubiquinone/menaquinone biosynthesis C-methylase UbiE
MSQPSNNCASICDFAGSYDVGLLPEIRAMEQHVLGCQYGATSWTTRAQAEEIGNSLGISQDSNVLDVGGGAGWPSLFLCSMTGGQFVIIDPTDSALELAGQRAEKDGLSSNVTTICGSGTAIPCADGSFDYVIHADVLCCMPEKLGLLRECHRVAKNGANMHFSVIRPATDLDAADYQAVINTGPPFVEVSEGYPILLQQAGWSIAEHQDLSEQYLSTMTSLVNYLQEHADVVSAAIGQVDYDQMLSHRNNQLALIKKGWLRRDVFIAEK